MSKRLYLLRHAKSSWKHPELTDHERPLSGRGRRAATAIARHLDQREIAPELVWCSTARRAPETVERIDAALAAAAVKYEPRLSAATAGALLERLHGVPDAIASVMLIGHNPAIEQLALDLAPPSLERRELETKSRRPRSPSSSSSAELARRPSRRGDARQRRTTPRSQDLTQQSNEPWPRSDSRGVTLCPRRRSPRPPGRCSLSQDENAC
jgi:phosphohistidine phosphatase